MRAHGILVAMTLLTVLGTSCGNDDSNCRCPAEISCQLEDCSCTVDDDCTIQVCGFEPSAWGSEGSYCDWCMGCNNGYPLPVSAWESLEERWQEICAQGDCTGGGCDIDCFVDCIYVPVCKRGNCIGEISEEHPTGWCG